MKYRRGGAEAPLDESWRGDVRRRFGKAQRRLHIVGIGNPIREDDALGLEVASSLRRLLKGRTPTWVKIHPPVLNPEMVLPRIPVGERIVIFDAVQAMKEPGAIVCASLDDTRYGFFATHDVPLRLMPSLGGRGDQVSVIGIQPASVEVGEGLTPTVRASVEALAEEIASAVVAEND